MARVQIYLDEHETIEEAQELLKKALTAHENGEVHQKDSFHQPAARDVFETMINAHDAMWQKTLKEILEVIDQEA